MLLVLSTGGLAAQLPDYHLQQFDYSTGIRPGAIAGLERDEKGFLWILYKRSVQRFDGTRVTDFRVDGNLKHIAADSTGRIWVLTDHTVFLFNEALQRFIPVQVEMDGMYFGRFFRMPGRAMMLAADKGFFEYDQAARLFRRVFTGMKVAPPYRIGLFAVAGHSLFFGKDSSICRYNTRTDRYDFMPDRNVQEIMPVGEDSVAVSTWELSTYWYDFASRRSSLIEVPDNREPDGYQGKRSFGIRTMVRSAGDRYILASTHGIFEYETGKKSFSPLVMFDKGRQIRTSGFTSFLFVDAEDYVWMTSPDGVARFPLHGQAFGLIRVSTLDFRLPPAIDNVQAIAGDRKNNLWLATGAGFVGWNKNTKRFSLYFAEENASDKLAYPSVRGIATDDRYVILAPANRGIWLYDPENHRYLRPGYDSPQTKELSGQDLMDGITTLRNGDHIITGKDAVYLLDGKTYVLSRLESPADRENANYCFQTADGFVWISTQSGMHLFDSDLHYVQKLVLPAGAHVSAGFAARDSSLLFALGKGLYTARCVNGELHVVKKKTAVFDDIHISSLFQDHKGFIWASSDYGIYRYDSLHKSLILYDYTDNIQGYGFNANSIYPGNDGTIYFGGINGVNYFNPSELPANRDQLRVYISGIRFPDDSLLYDLSRPGLFSYSQRSFEAGFTAPYFNNARKVFYRYRISGLDNQWKELGNASHIRVANLPPGSYLLEVEASVNRTDWVRAQNSFSFTITPPFWMRWWFIGSCLLVAGSGFFALIRFRRQRRVEKQQREDERRSALQSLAETRQRMAEVEMQALRAQMNPHFIFNCLNSINRYIVKSDQATASLYLTRFARLIRLILDNSNSSYISLSNELDALRLYVDMESIRFDKKFTCSFLIDENVQADAVFVPPLILQPYVENSIWHGLLHKEEAGHLRISVRMVRPGILQYEIEDNGIGRARAMEMKSKSVSTKKSLGMKLTEDRLELLNKRSSIHTSVEITDLFDKAGLPAGTRVIIRLPVDH